MRRAVSFNTPRHLASHVRTIDFVVIERGPTNRFRQQMFGTYARLPPVVRNQARPSREIQLKSIPRTDELFITIGCINNSRPQNVAARNKPAAARQEPFSCVDDRGNVLLKPWQPAAQVSNDPARRFIQRHLSRPPFKELNPISEPLSCG